MTTTRLATVAKVLLAAIMFLRLAGVTWLPSAPLAAGALIAWLVVESVRRQGRSALAWMDWYVLGLTAILVAAVAVRLPSIGADLWRQPPDIDGHRLAASIRHFFIEGWIEHRTVEHYPGIVFWAMSTTSLGMFLYGLMTGTIRAIEYTSVEHFMLAGRITNVAIATGTVACTAGIARALSGRGAALAAAAVVAFAPLAIDTTTDMRNDAGQVLLLVAAVLAAVRATGASSSGAIAAAGACAGLAAGVKYTSVFVLVPVLIAAVDAPPDRRWRRTLAALGAFTAAVALTNHFLWWDFPNFVRQLSDQIEITGSGHWAASSNPAAVHRTVLSTVGPGWPLLVIGAAWGVWELAAGRRSAWLFWSFPLLYSWFTTHRPSQFARWVYPLLPFLAVAGASGLVALSDVVRRWPGWTRVARPAAARAVAVSAIGVLALGPPMWAGAGTVSRRLTPSTAVLLERWLKERVPRGQVVLVEDGWLDLRDAPFDVLRVPDLAWALDPARNVAAAADFVVVPETHFTNRTLAGLDVVKTLDAEPRRFGGHLGFDYRVYAARRAEPADAVDARLDTPAAVPMLGWDWDPRAGGGPGLMVPDRSAIVFVPPLARDDAMLQLDLANAGDAWSPVPVVVTIVTQGERKVPMAEVGFPGPGLRRLAGHLRLGTGPRAIPIRIDPVRRGARLRLVAVRLGPDAND